VTVSVLGGQLAWQYGTTTSYGTTTRSVSTGLLGVAQTLSVAVTGLTASTTYHVRAVAKSGLTTSYGRDVTFTTSAAPSGGSGSGSGSGSSGSGSSGSGSSGSGSSGSGSSGSGSSGSGSSGSGSSGSGSSGSGDTATDGAASGDSSSSGTAGGGGASGASGDGSGATTAPGVATADVTPVLGKTLAIAAVNGTVTATAPSGQAVDLSAAQAVPTGTLIDTRAGTVELTSALDRKGTTQTGRFWGGLFEAHQATTARGLTQLVLRGGDFSGCPPATAAGRGAVAHAATTTKSKKKKKSPPRSLWGSDDHGRFATRGRGSVATVRGTRWHTEDRCDGTLTSVTAGAVAVRDLRRNRTVVVTKNHHYLARIAP
jgi:hypothetical protein